MNVGATVACAVSRAIGRPVTELPLTPPRVLGLLKGADHTAKCSCLYFKELIDL